MSRAIQNFEEEMILSVHMARDLLFNMLKINPEERYSVEDALNHPYTMVQGTKF